MQASDQSIESLHREASSQYLQGKFDEALASWRQILLADPNDERAREGVRLCELLTDESPVEADVEATPEQDTEPEDMIEFEVPALDVGNLEAEIDTPEVTPDAVVEDDLLGGAELVSTEAIEPLVAPEAIDQPTTVDDPAGMGSIVDGVLELAEEDDAAPSLDGDDVAASELQKRVKDLIAEARSASESGDNETARSVLARVFILDDANPDAQALQEEIENTVPAIEDQPADVPPIAGTEPDLELPDDPWPAAKTPKAPVEEDLDFGEAAPPADMDVAEEEEQDDEFEIDGLDPVPATPKAPPTAVRRGIKLPQLDFGNSKTRWIVIGAVVGVFAVVGAGFFFKLRSIEIRDVPPPIVEAAAGAARETVAESAEPVPEAVPTSVATEDVATLLERGRTASDSGDYAAAIVAFDAVLKQEPGNTEAKNSLEVVTEAYRLEQATQREWDSARKQFRDGDYRAALRMFYRLTTATDEERVKVERYIENSWYNLGIQALRSRRCDDAREHLNEAAAIDPEDTEIASALALCDTCNSLSRRTAETTVLRGLDRP